MKKSRYEVTDFETSTLPKELGGVLKSATFETRVFEGKVVYAIDFSPNRTNAFSTSALAFSGNLSISAFSFLIKEIPTAR